MATVPARPAVRPIIGTSSSLRMAMLRLRTRTIVLGGAILVAAVAGAVTMLATGPGSTSSAPVVPRFVEEATDAGLTHRYDGEFTFFVGGGVAVMDCDRDGLPDLFLAGGAEPATLHRNESPIGGALRFTRLASPATDLTAVTGAYPIDVDGDANVDLAVLRVGENVLLRGLGDCVFERANEAWGIEGGDAWTTAFSATWEGAASLPTLAFGNYLELDDDEEPTYECDDNQLVRPDGASYREPIALEPGWCTLSLLFSDWDRSGRRDLRVSNDRHYYRDGEEQLWRVEAERAPELWTAAEGWRTLRVFGMGIASADLTDDGYPEVYLTSQGDNKLQTLVGDAGTPEYGDIALRRGATAHRPYVGDTTMASTAWHPEFADVNNDGVLDLFVSKGNVEAMTEYAARDPSNLLIGQGDGTFVEGGEDAGIAGFSRARGAAVVDLNLDGLRDLVVVNRRENVSLWRNVGTGTAGAPEAMGSWLALRIQQSGANHDAIGAWIEVRAGDRTWRTERTIGGGHVSGQLGWIHIGLGGHDRAEVRVTWPDGEVGPWLRVDANGFAILDRGKDGVRRWTPGEEMSP
jgi:hypothetical protein